MALGQLIQDGLLNWLKGDPFPLAPSAVYVSLHSGNPATGVNEVSGTLGGRVELAAVNFSSNAWMDSVVGGIREMVNTTGVVFDLAATGVTVEGFALWDAPTGGNLLISGSVTPPSTVTAGDPVVFLVGDLKVRI